MTKKIKFTIDKIKYIQIRDLSFSYLVPDDVELPGKNAEAIQYSIEIVKLLSTEDEIVRLVFTITLKTEAENNKETKGIYITEHLFKVENFNDLIIKTDDHFEVNNILDNTLTGLAYSTIRGLFYQKFNGTRFSNFILPIIKPADLANK